MTMEEVAAEARSDFNTLGLGLRHEPFRNAADDVSDHGEPQHDGASERTGKNDNHHNGSTTTG